MSTEFINDQWRLPNAWNGTESNVNKQSNYSMDFDSASSDYINAGNTDYLNNLTEMSLSIWFNLDTAAINKGLIGDFVYSPAQGHFSLLTKLVLGNNYGLRLYINNAPNDTINISGTPFTAGQWHHLVMIYENSTFSFYVDGSPVSSSGDTPFSSFPNSTSTLNIGRYSTLEWDGKIDGVAIYNYALSSSQVTTLYGSSSTGIGNPMSLSPKPVAYYPLGDQDAFNGSNYLVPNSSMKDYVFDFNGNDDITVSHNSYFDQSVYSFSFWINNNLNSGVSNDGIITADSTTRGWSMLQDNQTFKFNPNISGGSGQINVTNFFNTTSTWIHCAITFDGTNLIIYKNGTSVGSLSSGTRNLNSNNNPLTIGNNTFASGRFFNGKLSNVQIFSTALPSTGSNSVETLYNNGSPLTSMSGFTSLVSWYKLNASDTYDSSTGNWTIEDHAGSNDGTSSGMTQANLVQSDLSFTSGFSPYALNFDGASSDAITLGNTIGNSFTQITCSIWANISTSGLTQSTYRNFLVKFPTSGFSATPFELRSSNGNRVDTYNNKLFFRVNTNTGSYGFTDTGFEFTEANKWHHLVGTYDGSNVKLFVDGVEYYSISASGTLNSNPNNATIGKSGSTGDFNGKLSNASIWNAALTSAQITELYNEGVPSNLNNHSAYSNLVSWWQLGSNSSFNTNWTVLDEKGSNNGTSVNMTEDAIVDGVGSYANGLSSGMGGDEVIGSAPFSDANSLSVNMDVEDRVTDTPS